LVIKKSTIIVIGSSNFDINLKVKEIPIIGETVLSNGMETGFGGKGTNQVFTINKIGGKADYLTCIGDDVFGKLYLDNLKENHLNLHFINIIKNQKNGIAVVNIDSSGKNTIIVYPGSSIFLTPDIILKNLNKILEYEIIMTQLEIPVETAELLAEKKNPGNIFVLNPSPVNKEYDYSKLLKKVDILIPNEIELSQLTCIEIKNIHEVEKAAQKILDTGVKNLIVTLGNKGVFVKNRNIKKYIESTNFKPVDTSGAGDAFIGAFLYKFSTTKDLIKSVDFANKVAGISVTRYGTHKSVPTAEEIEDMKDFFES